MRAKQVCGSLNGFAVSFMVFFRTVFLVSTLVASLAGQVQRRTKVQIKTPLKFTRAISIISLVTESGGQ